MPENCQTLQLNPGWTSEKTLSSDNTSREASRVFDVLRTNKQWSHIYRGWPAIALFSARRADHSFVPGDSKTYLDRERREFEMERQHQEPNQHRNRFELPAEVPAEGAFVQRLPQNPIASGRSATSPPSPSPRDRRDRPVIEDLTKIVLPLLFALHFAITGGIVLNYTLSLNRALPRKYTIGAVITFGVLIFLEIVGVTVLYFQRKCDRKRYGVAQRNHRVARDVEGGGGSRSGSRMRGGWGKGKGPELVRGGVIAGDRWWQRAWEWLKECYQQKLCFHCGFGFDKWTAGQVNGAVDGPAASAEISPRVLEQGEQHSNEGTTPASCESNYCGRGRLGSGA